MARCVPWDKFETALLIETFWRVRNHEEELFVSLENLSSNLRRYATNNGIEIDVEYRDFNELRMQLETIKGLFVPQNAINQSSATVFEMMVNLYNNENEKFVQVLRDAHILVLFNVDTRGDSYKAWLDLNLNTKHRSVKVILECFEEASKYSLKHGIANKSFVDIKDFKEFNSIRTKLSMDKIFKRSFPKAFTVFENTGKYYSNFLKEKSDNISEKSESVLLDNHLSKQQVCVLEEESLIHLTTSYIVDFSDKEANYSFTKPSTIRLFGTSYNVTFWSEVYILVIKSLLENAATEAKKYIAEQILNTKKRPLFAYSKKDLINSKEITDECFAETNFCSTDVVELIRKVCVFCGFDPNKILVISYIKENKAGIPNKKDTEIAVSDKKDNVITSRQISKMQLQDTGFSIGDDKNIDVYKKVLANHFSYGFAIDSYIELRRFRLFYEEDSGNECVLVDENLKSLIKSIGFEYEKKIYDISTQSYDHIKEVINHETIMGSTILYYEMIFDVNESWLSGAHILSSEMLKAIIKSLLPNLIYRLSYMVLISDKMTEFGYLKNELLRVWGDNLLQSYDDLSQKLIYVPIEKIKYALAQDEEFVWNSQEIYTLTSLFKIGVDEIDALQSFAKEKCFSNGTVLFSELPITDVCFSNSQLSTNAIINALYIIAFKEHFCKSRQALSLKDSGNTAEQEALSYCKSKERCTMQELCNLWKEKTGTSEYSKVLAIANENLVRVDVSNFVCDNNVQFDILAIDKALSNIIKGDFIGLKEISTFVLFPYCGFTWNLFLVESYCRRFSKLYKYDALVANSRNAGAIIKRTSNLSYEQVIEQAVASSKVNLEKTSIINYLNEAGYLGKHSYSNIENLIKKAIELRKR